MSSNRSRKKTSSHRKSSSQRRSHSQQKPKPFYTIFAEKQAQRDLLHADAVTRFELQGPICYTEGAYQHTGECWNDVAYMVFMFSDGIKEITQPAVMKGDLDTMAARLPDVPRARAYLEALRARFVRHYLNQTYTDALSSINLNAALRTHGPHRAGGVNAYAAAVMGAPACQDGYGTNRPFEVSAANYKAGYKPSIVASNLNALFDLYNVISVNISNSLEPRLYTLPAKNPDETTALILTSKNAKEVHITCFFTCNTVDYFYDNQLGVFQVPWHPYFARGMRLLMVQYKGVSNHWPAFYDGEHLHVPMAKSSILNVVPWDGDLTKTTTWRSHGAEFGYFNGLFLASVLAIKLEGEAVPITGKAPSVVGRGHYRVPFAAPSNDDL
jgi:hypothetical protein